MIKSSKSGFTLIELLVVVAIIGLLSSIVLASLSTARERAQNVATVATVKQVQTTMEIYYLDNGTYPILTPGTYACIGAATCTGPNGPVESQITLNLPESETLQEKGFAAVILNTGYFTAFSNLATPLVYQYVSPTVSGIYYPQKSGNTTTYYYQKAGGGSPATTGS